MEFLTDIVIIGLTITFKTILKVLTCLTGASKLGFDRLLTDQITYSGFSDPVSYSYFAYSFSSACSLAIGVNSKKKKKKLIEKI